MLLPTEDYRWGALDKHEEAVVAIPSDLHIAQIEAVPTENDVLSSRPKDAWDLTLSLVQN
jgi:hypothetical protein